MFYIILLYVIIPVLLVYCDTYSLFLYMVFGIVHPYIFIHFMEMFFILVSLVFNIHCIHVCVDIVRKRFGNCMCGVTSAKKHFKTKGRCL